MFEMKNESAQPQQKKKMKIFLRNSIKIEKRKIDEYAVLVSLLETENEFYNNGIVDMDNFQKCMDKTTIFYSYNYPFKKCSKKFSQI